MLLTCCSLFISFSRLLACLLRVPSRLPLPPCQWTASPIYDVSFVSTLSACPAGFKVQSERWGGTFPACACPAAHSANSTDTTACTVELKSAPYNCQTRDAIPAVDVHIAPTLKLCIARGGINALSRPLSKMDGTCPPGSMQCGTSAANYFCAPTSGIPGAAGRCPITDFALSADRAVPATETRISKSALPIAVVDGVALHLYTARGGSLESVLSVNTRSPGSQPVSFMPLTDIEMISGRPCLISSSCDYAGRSAELLAQERNAETLLPTKGYMLADGHVGCNGCTKPPDVPGGSVSPQGYDIRYVEAYSREERLAHIDAALPVPYRTTDSRYRYTIQARSEVAWSNQCAKTRKQIYDQRDNVAHIKNFQIVLLIISIFTFLIFSCCIPIKEYQTRGRWTDNRAAWYGKTALNVGFKLFVIAFTIATMALALSVLAYWKKVNGSSATNTCADPMSTEVFKILAADYESLSYSNIGSSVAMAGTGFFDAFVKAMLTCCK